VFLACRGVAEVVLLAQFVGDIFRGGIEIPRLADDFRASSAVVRELPQRTDVDAVVSPRPAAARPEDLRESAAGPAWKRKRNWDARWISRNWGGTRTGTIGRELRFSVNPDRVHQHFALADLLLQPIHVRMARGVVAVGNDQQCLFAVLAFG